MKKWFISCCIGFMLLSGCSANPETSANEPKQTVALPQFDALKSGDTLAILKTTMGDIKVRLFPDIAPKAVENFVTHAKNGYYDNLSFHRVMQDFMIQGGDPNGNGTGGESIWGKPFADEFSEQLYCFNGALAMANSGVDTNGSQFFIVQNKDGNALSEEYFEKVYAGAKENNWPNADFRHPENVKKKYQEVGGTPHLDRMHTVFGQVIEGMDVVEAIAKVPTDKQNHPLEEVYITSILIEEVKE